MKPFSLFHFSFPAFCLACCLLPGCASQAAKLALEGSPPVEGNPHIEKGNSVTDFWGAMDDIDFSFVESNPVTEDEKLFSRALEAALTGDTAVAESQLKDILGASQDTRLLKESGDVLERLYIGRAAYADYVELATKRSAGGLGDTGNIALFRAFSEGPAESYSFSEDESRMPLSLTYGKNPVIEVSVNGKKRRFWIDTGASHTVLSAATAKACGVSALDTGDTQPSALSGTGKVNIQAAIIPDLRIGSLRIANHPAYILPTKNMEYRFLGIRMMKIDGIIGWAAIKHMDLEIDFYHKSAVIHPPIQRQVREKNLSCMEFPLLKIGDSDGGAHYFGIDTGASYSWVTDRFITKFPRQPLSSKHVRLWSAAGSRKVKHRLLPSLSLRLDNELSQFSNISVTENLDFTPFPKMEGMIGVDAFMSGSLKLDWHNRSYSFIQHR